MVSAGAQDKTPGKLRGKAVDLHHFLLAARGENNEVSHLFGVCHSCPVSG